MPCLSNLESLLVRPQTPFPQQCPLLHTNPTKIPQRTPSAQTFGCLSVHCSVCAGCERSQGVGVLDWLPLAIPPTHPFGQLDCDITSCSFIWPARKLWESWSHLVMSCLDQLDRSDFLCSSSQLHVHCSAASNQTLGVFTSFLFGHIEPLELVEKSFQQIYMFR